MWIPLQPDGVTLRRLPWVTFALLGFMTLCQLGLSLFPKSRLKAPLQEMVSFSANHSYLKTSPEIRAIVQANGHTVNVFKQSPVNAAVRAKQQRMLNSLTQQFQVAWHKHPLYYLAFQPPFTFKGSLVSHVFVSGSVLLFFWNLFVLYVCAPLVEDRWGRVYFGLFLGFSAFLGALGHSLHLSESALPLVGAGSLVAGVLGAYAVILDDHRIPIRLLISRMDTEYRVPAWGIFLVWLVGCGILIFATGGAMKLVSPSWPSLIYPFAFGLVAAGVIRWQKLEKKLYRSPFERLEKDQQYLVRIDRELRVGSPKKALEIMWEASKAYPDRLDFLQPCWDQAMRTGVFKDIDSIGKSLLNHYFQAGDLDAAWFILEEIDKQNINFNLPYERQIKWSEALFFAGRGSQAAELLFRHAHPIPQQAVLRDQILQLAMDGDAQKAHGLITRWQQDSQASVDDLQVLERIKAKLTQEIPEHDPDVVEAIPIVDDRPAHLLDEDPFASTHIQVLRVIPVQPVALHRETISIRISGKQKSLPFSRIHAIAACSLQHSHDSHSLIDLHLDDPLEPGSKHQVLRMSSHRLNPEDSLGQKLAKGEQAFLKLGRWIAKDAIRLFPEYDLFQKQELLKYTSVADFEADVYGATSGDPDPI